MSILVALPTDVTTPILTKWVTVVDVVGVDSASCCARHSVGHRTAVLSILYLATHVYNTAGSLSNVDFKTVACFARWTLLRTPNVTAVHISADFAEAFELSRSYLHRCGNSVTAINWSGCELFGSINGYRLGSLCPRVTSIACSPAWCVRDYHDIVRAWPELLCITFPVKVPCEALQLIALCCRKLVSVTVNGSLSASAKRDLLLALPPTVETLDIAELDVVRFLTTAQLPRLHELRRGFATALRDEHLPALAQCCSLKTLHLRRFDEVTPTALSEFSKLCQLEHVAISDGQSFRPECVTALLQGCAPTLRTLKYHVLGRLTMRILTAVGTHCRNLEELSIDADGAEEDSKVWLAVVAGCPKLASLTVPGSSITDTALYEVAAGCPLLHTVIISGDRGGQLSNRAMCAVGQSCKHLRNLQVTGCNQVTHAGICELLASGPRLRSVVLAVEHADTILLLLAQHCKNLRRLVLCAPSGADLQVHDYFVRAMVRQCGQLRVLVFVGAPAITAEITPAIAEHCKLLRQLCFTGCAQFHCDDHWMLEMLFAYGMELRIE